MTFSYLSLFINRYLIFLSVMLKCRYFIELLSSWQKEVWFFFCVWFYGFTLDIPVSVHLSISCPSVCILFPDDSMSKHQWIFTKLGMCIDIVEIWFGIANGQILSNFDKKLSVSGERMCTILVNRLED